MSEPKQSANSRTDLIQKAAVLHALGVGKVVAAKKVGLSLRSLYRYDDLWKRELESAKYLTQLSGREPEIGAPKSIRDRLRNLALLRALGIGSLEAYRKLNLHPMAIQRNVRNYKELWEKERKAADWLVNLAGGKPKKSPPEIHSRIRKAAFLCALGLRKADVMKRLNLSEYAIASRHELWRKEEKTAKELLQLAEQPGNELPADGIQRRLTKAAKLLVKGLSMADASRGVGMRSRWLNDTIGRRPELWGPACWKAGVDPRIWQPRFRGLRIPTRQNMLRAALIVASGASMAEASRRLGLVSDSVIGQSAREHTELWESLLTEARQTLGVPTGLEQRARLFENGKKVKKQPNRRGGRVPVAKAAKPKRSSVGRKKSPAREIIQRELEKAPSMGAQELANIINRACATWITAGKMAKQKAGAVRELIRVMRKEGELPAARQETVRK